MPVGERKFLFEDAEDEKQEKIHEAVEKIRKRAGYDSIYRAGSSGEMIHSFSAASMPSTHRDMLL